MSIYKRSLLIFVIVVILSTLMIADGLAQSPYAVTSDTYTDRIRPSETHGSDINLSLNATNLTSCVETTYVWFKFAIPSTGTQISTAELTLTFNPAGSGPMDLELHSADPSWDEQTLSWATQTGLVDPTVLATSTGNLGGSTTFSGLDLVIFLNSNQGQTVSFVVFADCDGTVPSAGALAVASLENSNGSGISLSMFGPNALTISSLSAKNQSYPSLINFLVVASILLGITITYRKIKKINSL